MIVELTLVEMFALCVIWIWFMEYFKRFSDSKNSKNFPESLFSISSSTVQFIVIVCLILFMHLLTLTRANEIELVNKPVENQWTFAYKYGYYNSFVSKH